MWKGEYGYCQEAGEPIGLHRLLARTTTAFSADVRLYHELKEHIFVKDKND